MHSSRLENFFGGIFLMASYHVNPETGNPGVCRAKISCRFGDSDKHFDSKEAAREAYETEQESLRTPVKPILNSSNEIRFGKLTSKTDIAKLGATLRNHWQLKPQKRFKIKDRYGFGLGVYAVSYDAQKDEFQFEKHRYRMIETLESSRNLNQLLGKIADKVGYADHEQHTIDWDE
jgi:hypothetical protein